jgi:hypothetical protein
LLKIHSPDPSHVNILSRLRRLLRKTNQWPEVLRFFVVRYDETFIRLFFKILERFYNFSRFEPAPLFPPKRFPTGWHQYAATPTNIRWFFYRQSPHFLHNMSEIAGFRTLPNRVVRATA